MDNYLYCNYCLKENRQQKSELSKAFATQNGLEYVEDVVKYSIADASIPGQKFYAKENRYILLTPLNEGRYINRILWYGDFEYNRTKLILSNQDAFYTIKNLDSILLQIIKLYEKYLDEEWIISVEGLGIKLLDSIGQNYRGRAELFITENCILNDIVKPEKINDAKKYCISKFLYCFMGLNFGIVIKESSELEKALLQLEKKVTEKRLKREIMSDRWINTEHVKPYKFENISKEKV